MERSNIFLYSLSEICYPYSDMNSVLTIFTLILASKLVVELCLNVFNAREVARNRGLIPKVFEGIVDQAIYVSVYRL